jgi:hypothetical protein
MLFRLRNRINVSQLKSPADLIGVENAGFKRNEKGNPYIYQAKKSLDSISKKMPQKSRGFNEESHLKQKGLLGLFDCR